MSRCALPRSSVRLILLVSLLNGLGARLVSAQESCVPTRADAAPIALTGVTLWDGTESPSRPGMTILIRGERITAVFPDGREPLPADATIRDLSGKFVIPGLIDGHVHVAGQPSGEDSRVRVTQRLCRALLGGVTSVRDMAGDGRVLAALQRDAQVGDLVSPDIYYAALWAGPAFFTDPRTADASAGLVPGSALWMRAVDSTVDLRQAVAEAKGTGATAVKLYQAMSPELVARISAEAKRQGLRVWAHAAMSAVRPSQMATTGVETVSHGFMPVAELSADEQRSVREARGDTTLSILRDPRLARVFEAYRAHEIVFEPTLFIYRSDTSGVRPRLAAWFTQRAHAAGVAILAGTDSLGSGDAGGMPLPNLHEELAMLVSQGGLTPVEALVAATRTAARVLGEEANLGTLTPGTLANLVVLDADPTRDIRNTRRVHLVMKRGATYRRNGFVVPPLLAASVLPLPEALRGGAGVRTVGSDGIRVVRPSTNGMMCTADRPGDDLFDVRCYREDFLAVMDHVRALRRAGTADSAIDARVRDDDRRGVIRLPSSPTAGYRMLGPIGALDTTGMVAGEAINGWQSVHFPFRTAEELGLPVTRQGTMPFVMDSGTWWSRVMIVHRPTPDE